MSSAKPIIRSATADDAAAIASIYNHYVRETLVTFEEEPISVEQMRGRIVDVLSTHLWLVYEQNGEMEGYAYASKWHARSAYRRSVETTVYLDSTKLRRGRGTQLYGELIQALKVRGYHVAVGGISVPNAASVALHEKCGFEKVAHFKEIGWKFNRWIDVGYWQLML
jgi:L-amino acid N-acyltransferase YncA